MNRTIIGLFKKELTQTFRDKRMWALLFIMPIVQLALFGLAISTEVKNIKLGAVYGPNDILARRMVEHCLASKWFIPAVGEEADTFHWVQSGRADVVLITPPGGLTRAVERGRGEVQLLVNASNVLKAQNIEGYMQNILDQVVTGTKAGPVVTLKARVLYNPELQTSIFMVPGVLCMLLCVLTIMLTGMAFTREKELGTFEALIASPAKPWEILLGKSLPFVFLAMVDFPLVLAAAILGFGVPMRGSYLILSVSGLTFVGTTVSIGILISTVARTQQQAMMAGFLFLFRPSSCRASFSRLKTCRWF